MEYFLQHLSSCKTSHPCIQSFTQNCISCIRLLQESRVSAQPWQALSAINCTPVSLTISLFSQCFSVKWSLSVKQREAKQRESHIGLRDVALACKPCESYESLCRLDGSHAHSLKAFQSCLVLHGHASHPGSPLNTPCLDPY